MSESKAILDRLTNRSRDVLRTAAAFCQNRGHEDISPHDLIDALAHMGGVSDAVLVDAGYPRKEMPAVIPNADQLLGTSRLLKTFIAEAHRQCSLLGHNYVGTEHLLLALMRTNPELLPDAEEVRLSVLRILGHVD